jgi:hypothetical protein
MYGLATGPTRKVPSGSILAKKAFDRASFGDFQSVAAAVTMRRSALRTRESVSSGAVRFMP